VSGCVAVVKSTEADQVSLLIRAAGGRRHRSGAIVQSAVRRGVKEFPPGPIKIRACVGAIGRKTKFRV